MPDELGALEALSRGPRLTRDLGIPDAQLVRDRREDRSSASPVCSLSAGVGAEAARRAIRRERRPAGTRAAFLNAARAVCHRIRGVTVTVTVVPTPHVAQIGAEAGRHISQNGRGRRAGPRLWLRLDGARRNRSSLRIRFRRATAIAARHLRVSIAWALSRAGSLNGMRRRRSLLVCRTPIALECRTPIAVQAARLEPEQGEPQGPARAACGELCECAHLAAFADPSLG